MLGSQPSCLRFPQTGLSNYLVRAVTRALGSLGGAFLQSCAYFVRAKLCREGGQA